MNQKRPLIIAHRGSSDYLPENTLEAFRLASDEHQADIIELDVRTSKDGVLVVIHDEDLDRTTDGKGPVLKQTFRSLQSLDAGFYFDPDGKGSYPQRGKGITIPSLEEALTVFPQKAFAIEIKEDSKERTCAVMELLTQYQTHPLSAVGSKYHRVSQTIRKYYPGWKRFFSKQDVIWDLMKIICFQNRKSFQPHTIASVPLTYWGIHFDNERWIQHLHAQQAAAYFWVGNDLSTIQRLTRLGADGLVTNDPLFARQAMNHLSGTESTNA